MNKKIIFILFLMIGLYGSLKSQERKIELKGVIINGKTSKPIPFANIELVGTVAGTATNSDGEFELTIPHKYVSSKIKISAVGYAVKEIKVFELNKPNLKISLSPVAYSLNKAEVYEESLRFKVMIINIVKNISKNYHQSELGYSGYFKHIIKKNGELYSKQEAMADVYDRRGYIRSNPQEVYKDINYSFSQFRFGLGDDEINPKDRFIYFDGILINDVIKNSRNILNKDYLNHFKYADGGVFQFEGSSIQKINYSSPNPNIDVTGIANATSYKGELFLDAKTKAVIKNITEVILKGKSHLGYEFMAVGREKDISIKMTTEVNYTKVRDKYFMSNSVVRYQYNIGGDIFEEVFEFNTDKINFMKPIKIEGRVYYETAPYNKEFWKKYLKSMIKES